jgi:formylglycine-generating enzyme required for sulfatase activity
VNHRLPIVEAIRLALDLLSALEALHGADLVHRDVKPHNVIFVQGVPKLADVGLAAVVQTQMSLAGTPGYVPLDGSTGPDADLYALGKLLYQAVTGCEPADFPTLPACLLSGPDAGLLRRLNPVLLRACAPTRRDRFRSGVELRRALVAALNPSPIRFRNPILLAVLTLILLACLLVLVGRRFPSQADPPRAGPVYFRPGDDATAAQKELARQINQPPVRTNSLGMKLALIPAGEFLMGSPEDEEGRFQDEDLHRVQISHPFYLGIYEVTQDEYQSLMGDNPSRYIGSRHPVEQVSWKEAVAFCDRLTQADGVRYRLPTEAEWEYACRAGTTTRTYLGHSVRFDQGNIQGVQTLPVGQYPSNPFGLFDLYGNVYEWCADWYAADYYRQAPGVDPQGPAQGERRVLRGAGWFDGPGTRERTDRRIRSAYRGARELPDFRSNRIGFRVLREIQPVEQPPG